MVLTCLKAKGTSGEVTTTPPQQNCQAFWVSGAKDPQFLILVWEGRKSAPWLCWSCSSVRYNYGFPKSESGAWRDPVSGLSYRGHCKPTSETTAMLVCGITTLTLNAGWSVFVYQQYLFTSLTCLHSDKQKCNVSFTERFSATLRARH